MSTSNTRILADECCHAAVVEGLRAAGYDVTYLGEAAAARSDNDVLAAALAEDRLLLTSDKEFGEMMVRLAKPAAGVILVRMDEATPAARVTRLTAVLRLESERLKGHLIVVHAHRIRFHALPGR